MRVIAESKRELRRLCREKRDKISLPEWKASGEKMTEILLKTELWHDCDTVFSFVSMPNEPTTALILQAALAQGKRLLVPRIVGNGVMQAVEIHDLNELVPSTMGIYEPLNFCTAVDFSEISLAVIPCLCASPDGARLGKGGGYYDRFSADFSGKSVMFCAENFLMQNNEIPTEPHDKKTDYIITENKIIKCKK